MKPLPSPAQAKTPLTPETDAIAHAGLDEETYIGRMTYLARSLEIRLAEATDFIRECANDDLDRISPGMKKRASALLSVLSPQTKQT